MLKRKTNFEEIKRRLVINEKERKENNIFDYTLIVRENFLEETIEEIKKIIFNFQV